MHVPREGLRLGAYDDGFDRLARRITLRFCSFVLYLTYDDSDRQIVMETDLPRLKSSDISWIVHLEDKYDPCSTSTGARFLLLTITTTS